MTEQLYRVCWRIYVHSDSPYKCAPKTGESTTRPLPIGAATFIAEWERLTDAALGCNCDYWLEPV